MMSIGKLVAGPGVGRYYIDQVAQGREDYYAGEGEAAGVWMGTGVALLGLSGEVGEQELARLLEGRDPCSGLLLRPLRSSSPVAGFDLTLRAPKSVSILFGVAEREVAQRVVCAHELAVAEAIGYLEREACWTRRGAGGVIRLPGRGFVAAGFRHRSSRAGDPLLHTHVVVANATQTADGRWTALDGRELYRHAKTAGFLYQAALRAELSRELGLRWQPVVHGAADVEGVPRRVIEHFSQRRAEILELMGARGERSARAAQVATLETRRRKDYGVPVDRLREQWRARAAEHGLDRDALTRVLRPGPERRVEASDLAERLEGPDGLTRERSAFTLATCRTSPSTRATASSGRTRSSPRLRLESLPAPLDRRPQRADARSRRRSRPAVSPRSSARRRARGRGPAVSRLGSRWPRPPATARPGG